MPINEPSEDRAVIFIKPSTIAFSGQFEFLL